MDKETEILNLYNQGLRPPEIAEVISISDHLVRYYLHKMKLPLLYEIHCYNCDKLFIPKNTCQQKYCSVECSVDYQVSIKGRITKQDLYFERNRIYSSFNSLCENNIEKAIEVYNQILIEEGPCFKDEVIDGILEKHLKKNK